MAERWRRCLDELSPKPTLRKGVEEADLLAAEQELGHSLYIDLRELLLFTDGVEGTYGLGLVWPLERIVSDNLEMRNEDGVAGLYMPFQHLLFFGDAGNGSLFALTLHRGAIRRPDVFVWDHENDSRGWVAPSIDRYLEWWLAGKFSI